MKIKTNHIVSIFFFILYLGSYFLPFYSYNDETLLGYELYIFQLAGYVFIENVFEYLLFLLEVLIVVLVVLLFIWSLKEKTIQFYIVIPVSILANISWMFWYLQLEDTTGIAFGYWIWIISILGISIHSIFLSFKGLLAIKKNTATN